MTRKRQRWPAHVAGETISVVEADAVVDEHEEPTKPTAALPYAIEATAVVAALDTDADVGAERRRGRDPAGPARTERDHEREAAVGLGGGAGQFRNPMNIMLVAVTVVSFAIGEVSTGIIVALLILLNVVLGSRQELKARASVTALSNLQVPQAKVVRDGIARAGAGRRRRAGRHRAGRGGRHRARRRSDHPAGDARDPGGGAHGRERAGGEGRRACSRARTSRSVTGRTCCSRTPR